MRIAVADADASFLRRGRSATVTEAVTAISRTVVEIKDLGATSVMSRGPSWPCMLAAMDVADSALDTAAVAYARALLRRPARRQRMGPVLAAAAFAALSAITFATVMVMAPPAVTQHLPADRLGG